MLGQATAVLVAFAACLALEIAGGRHRLLLGQGRGFTRPTASGLRTGLVAIGRGAAALSGIRAPRLVLWQAAWRRRIAAFIQGIQSSARRDAPSVPRAFNLAIGVNVDGGSNSGGAGGCIQGCALAARNSVCRIVRAGADG